MLCTVLDTLQDLPTTPPSLYIDLEGESLSRYGTISIFQLYVLPTRRTYIIDVKNLGGSAFSTPSASGNTLRSILESATIPKVIFDVRHDSDALFAHFNVKLQGIQDLQLMELATRISGKSRVFGLSKCIQKDLALSWSECSEFARVKEIGIKLFDPKHGGRYQVFNARPLSDDLVLYCAQDVQYLPQLWACYNRKLERSPQWKTKVQSATKDRVAASQRAVYNGNGPHMALAPPGWGSV